MCLNQACNHAASAVRMSYKSGLYSGQPLIYLNGERNEGVYRLTMIDVSVVRDHLPLNRRATDHRRWGWGRRWRRARRRFTRSLMPLDDSDSAPLDIGWVMGGCVRGSRRRRPLPLDDPCPDALHSRRRTWRAFGPLYEPRAQPHTVQRRSTTGTSHSLPGMVHDSRAGLLPNLGWWRWRAGAYAPCSCLGDDALSNHR